MGTWGTKPLENDAALDLQAEFEDENSINVLGRVLASFLELPEDQRDADLCQEVIAAVHLWIESNKEVGPEFIQNALKCVSFILAESELKDLWTESDELDGWSKEMSILTEKIASKLS